MGYELDRLMQQYGVSSPTLGYAGASAPVEPIKPVLSTPSDGSTNSGNTMGSLLGRIKSFTNKADYDKAMEAYNANMVDYNAQKAAYEADRPAFNAYKQAYFDRVANTPQYTQAQYQTGPSAAIAWNTAHGGGRDAVSKNITEWVAQNPTATPQQIRAAMDRYGVNSYDVAQARGGSMWGSPLALPTYSGYVPPTTTATTTAGSTTDAPAQEIQLARGGSVHDMAQKYQVGGAVRRFEIGGAEGEPDTRTEMPMPAVTAQPGALQPRTPAPAAPAVAPVVPPNSPATPVSPAATDLMAMMQRYMGESSYAPEIKAARESLNTENAAFQKMIADAMKGPSSAPDKSEMYFRLAAAFGAPTRTGKFGETLAGVGKELGEYAKETRAANKADQALRMQLGIEAQKLKTAAAKEDLTTLRALAGEEMKDKRAIVQKYIDSGKPQSEAGKAAVDAGLQQGTPEFATFVNKYIDDKIRSGNLLKEAMVAISAGQLALAQNKETRQAESAAKLSPQEVKLKAEAETTLGGLDDSMSSLKRAYALNPNTFDGTLAATAQRKILEQTDPKDPRVLATREQTNLLSKGAIDKLRASFGGNPTEGERAALLSLEGIDSKSKEERAQIMKNTYKLLQARRTREQKRLNDISAGLYRDTTTTPSGEIE